MDVYLTAYRDFNLKRDLEENSLSLRSSRPGIDDQDQEEELLPSSLIWSRPITLDGSYSFSQNLSLGFPSHFVPFENVFLHIFLSAPTEEEATALRERGRHVQGVPMQSFLDEAYSEQASPSRKKDREWIEKIMASRLIRSQQLTSSLAATGQAKGRANTPILALNDPTVLYKRVSLLAYERLSEIKETIERQMQKRLLLSSAKTDDETKLASEVEGRMERSSHFQILSSGEKEGGKRDEDEEAMARLVATHRFYEEELASPYVAHLRPSVRLSVVQQMPTFQKNTIPPILQQTMDFYDDLEMYPTLYDHDFWLLASTWACLNESSLQERHSFSLQVDTVPFYQYMLQAQFQEQMKQQEKMMKLFDPREKKKEEEEEESFYSSVSSLMQQRPRTGSIERYYGEHSIYTHPQSLLSEEEGGAYPFHEVKERELAFLSDMDDTLRTILLNNPPFLLVLTFIVSILHFVFDMLSFRSEMSYWRKKKTFIGLSFKSMLMQFCFRIIIFLYLLDHGKTNWMIIFRFGGFM